MTPEEIKYDIKPINGYPDYFITNDGQVVSTKKGTQYRIKETIRKRYKYHQVSIRANKKQKLYLVHRLVALHFIPNPFGLSQVNHKDGNKSNNHISNLEWCDCDYNKKHAVMNNLVAFGDKHGMAKLNDACIHAIFKLKELKMSCTQIADILGVHKSAITYALIGKTWTRTIKKLTTNE